MKADHKDLASARSSPRFDLKDSQDLNSPFPTCATLHHRMSVLRCCHNRDLPPPKPQAQWRLQAQSFPEAKGMGTEISLCYMPTSLHTPNLRQHLHLAFLLFKRSTYALSQPGRMRDVSDLFLTSPMGRTRSSWWYRREVMSGWLSHFFDCICNLPWFPSRLRRIKILDAAHQGRRGCSCLLLRLRCNTLRGASDNSGGKE